MTHIAPEQPRMEPRTRRNSDTASLYSVRSEFSWKELIQPQTRYRETPMATFLGDDALDLVAPVYFEDSSSSDDGELCERPSERPSKQRGGYLCSPVPALDNSSITTLSSSGVSYIGQPPQMYGLQDHDGVLSTRRRIALVTVNRSTPTNGSYRCLFAFDACPVFSTPETWVNHVESHLRGIEPPKSCKCTICGESFETATPAITWSRFLHHVIGHKYHGNVNPDMEFLEYCISNDIISECTMNRSDPRPGKPQTRMSQEPFMYRKMTPRRFVNVSGREDNVATVDYPHEWLVEPESQETEYIMVPAKKERIRTRNPRS